MIKEKEKESARETTIPNEGIHRQIQSQRAVFSWSAKAGDPLVVFSGHEFHFKITPAFFFNSTRGEKKNSFPSKKCLPPQNKKERKKASFLFFCFSLSLSLSVVFHSRL
jgi:hypothetical protein